MKQVAPRSNRWFHLGKNHRSTSTVSFAKRSVGLSFARDRMSAVAVRSTGSHLTLLDSCTVINESQESYSLAYIETLREFVRRNRLRSWPVVLSIPNHWVIVRYMSVPSIPVPAIRQMVQVELGNTIHLPFEDPVYDVAQVTPLTQLEEGMQSIALVAAPREIVTSALQVAHNVGIRPIAIEIEPIALWRYAKYTMGDLPGLTVLMDIHETSVTLALFINDMLYFLRENEGSFDLFAADHGDDEIQRVCNDLVYEMDRVMNFFNFSLANQTRVPERIILSTYTDSDDRLADLLHEQTGIFVLSITSKAQEHGPFSGNDRIVQGSCIAATGLTLRGHISS